MKIGEYIKHHIRSHKLRQGSVADILDLSDYTFSYRLKHNSITATELFKLCDKLGLDIEKVKNEVEF